MACEQGVRGGLLDRVDLEEQLDVGLAEVVGEVLQ